MTPEQREDARVKAQRIVNAGGTENADYAVAVGFLSLIAQVEALTVPQGWKLVPIKPTLDMLDELTNGNDGKLSLMKLRYAQMLACIPTIPAIPGTKEGDHAQGFFGSVDLNGNWHPNHRLSLSPAEQAAHNAKLPK